MESIKRVHEPATIYNRTKLEECPPGIDIKKWQEFRNKYNKAANLEEIESPAQIDIELNSNCTLKCKFCIQSVKPINPPNLLGFEEFKNIIIQAENIGVTSLKLNYQNEVLMNSDVCNYIRFAKNHGFINIFFSTNATLLTPTVSEELIKSGLTKIFISLDAYTKETYLKLRGFKNFELIKSHILAFIAIRNSFNLKYPLVRVNFLKTTENIQELPDFISFWENKVDMINIQDMNPIIDSNSNLYIEKRDLFKCSMPFKQLVITAAGDILPCCTMHGIKHKIGNISSVSIEQAWESKKIKYLRDLHKNGNILKENICKTCIYGK